jgi:hypothetical protein
LKVERKVSLGEGRQIALKREEKSSLFDFTDITHTLSNFCMKKCQKRILTASLSLLTLKTH